MLHLVLFHHACFSRCTYGTSMGPVVSGARISCFIKVDSAAAEYSPFLGSILPRYYLGGIIHTWVSNGLTRIESLDSYAWYRVFELYVKYHYKWP